MIQACQSCSFVLIIEHTSYNSTACPFLRTRLTIFPRTPSRSTMYALFHSMRPWQKSDLFLDATRLGLLSPGEQNPSEPLWAGHGLCCQLWLGRRTQLLHKFQEVCLSRWCQPCCRSPVVHCRRWVRWRRCFCSLAHCCIRRLHDSSCARSYTRHPDSHSRRPSLDHDLQLLPWFPCPYTQFC